MGTDLVTEFAQLLDSFGKELKCPVCLGLMDQPFSPPCGHPACHECLLHAINCNRSCPVCKVSAQRRTLKPSNRFQKFVEAYRALQPQQLKEDLSTQFSQIIGFTQVYGAMAEHTHHNAASERKFSIGNSRMAMTTHNQRIAQNEYNHDKHSKRNTETCLETKNNNINAPSKGLIPSRPHNSSNYNRASPPENHHSKIDSEATHSSKCSSGCSVHHTDTLQTATHTEDIMEHEQSEHIQPVNNPILDGKIKPSNFSVHKNLRSPNDQKGHSLSDSNFASPTAHISDNNHHASTKRRRENYRAIRDADKSCHPNLTALTSVPDSATLTELLPSTPLVFVHDGLNRSEKKRLERLAGLVGATVQNTWSSNVSHCIVGTINVEIRSCSKLDALHTRNFQSHVPEDIVLAVERAASGTSVVRQRRSKNQYHNNFQSSTKSTLFLARKRTFKFLMAVVNGTWVVGPSWIDACLKEEDISSIIAEDPYQVVGDAETASSSSCVRPMLQLGPRKAHQTAHTRRITDETDPQTHCSKLLFQRVAIILIGQWHYPVPIEKDILAMLSGLGATVLRPESSAAMVDEFLTGIEHEADGYDLVITLADVDGCRLPSFLTDRLQASISNQNLRENSTYLVNLSWVYDCICTQTILNPSDYPARVRDAPTATKT